MILLALSLGAYLFALWKRNIIYAAIILQAAYITWRGAGLGRLPLVGPHDTVVFMTASIAAFSLPFLSLIKQKDRFISAVSVMASLFTVFSLVYKPHDFPLPPVLQTIWFELHVVLAFMSYALFAIAFILGGLYLKDREPEYEVLQYRAILIGYCLFTLSMIFGGIWAYLAWGTYWIWTPKELWTSILWIYYSFFLHARLIKWWSGKPSAYLSIAGFIIVMFTYLGVSLLMKSSHSF
ncbi:cytochrome c biogenesis protein CcsA [bacterium]|nr:cytochrome c biogenesis protein CcsA [bacterium]